LPALRTISETRSGPRRRRGYFRRLFFVRTLNFTIGRLTVEETGVLLRRRRRSRRASGEKKWRAIQIPAMAAVLRIANRIKLAKFTEIYLTHAVGM
jgi:hypothetical protein